MPVLSWAIQRGRCRGCGAAIGVGQLAAELGGALVGALAWLAGDGRALPALVLGWQLLLLALLDARSLWLPWRLSALLAASGLGMAAWQDHVSPGGMALVPALLGGGLGYAMLALVAWGYRRARAREGLGGGDPLLLGAIGTWVGPVGAIHVLLGAALLGLAVAAVMAWRGRDGGLTAQTMLPLGTFMAIAAWPVYLLG
jgi:leader peptidase (prepilin peptidase)/N-methyltransferase